MRWHQWYVWSCPVLFLAVVISACSSSTELPQDSTPPEAIVHLYTYELESICPGPVHFGISPMQSRDNVSPQAELRIRWDYNNDGTWDTDFQELQAHYPFAPKPLPVSVWTVVCELKDQAGNTVEHSESLALPDYIPSIPDIIAGEVCVSVYGADIDTLLVGQRFAMGAKRSAWLSSFGGHISTSYFIDGELVAESIEECRYPDPSIFFTPLKVVENGIGSPGQHELRVVLDSGDQVAETSELNNVSVRQIVVLEQTID